VASTDSQGRTEGEGRPGGSDPRLTEALARAFDAGRETYGRLALSREAFAAHVTGLLRRRLDRFDLEATPERLLVSLDAAAGPDLYLAAACDAGDEAAWRILHDRFDRHLAARLVRRGARGTKPAQLVHDLFGELAMPAPKGRARTLIGTFDGSGSLLGWLTSILSRRLGRKGGRKREHTLREVEDEAGVAYPRRATTAASDPFEAAAGRDQAAVWRRAFEHGWTQLSSRERLVLVLKYHEGLRQREVATALGITESAISRHVSRAVARLKLALRSSAIDGEPGADLWEALGRAVSENLSRSGAAIAPPPGRGDRPQAESP